MTATPARGWGWARKSALVVLGLLALVILTAGYCLANPNTLKPLAESITEWALDRTLEIDGDLTLSLSMKPVVSVTNARLGNAPGGSAPYMASASFAKAQIDLAALFEYRVHLLDLQAKEAVLYLEDSVGGRPNWMFFEAGEAQGDNPWSFMIQQLEITDSRIHATIGDLAPIDVTIPHLVETSDAEEHLNLIGHGEINGDPWRLNGRIGPFEEFLKAGQLVMDLELMVDDVEISASGRVGNLASLTEIDLSITIYGPDADLLGEIFRMPESFAGDVALEAAIQPTENGHKMRVLGHISDFNIETAGTITDLAALNGWDGSARITGPDLGVFGKALQIEGFPDGPFQIQGTLHLHGGDLDLKDVAVQTEDATLILNADFEQFPKRDGALANFRLSGEDISEFRTLLRLPGLPAVPFDVRLSLDATGSGVLESEITIGQHRLTAAGAVGEFPDYHGTEMTIDAAGQDIATLFQALQIPLPLAGAYEAASQLVIDADGITLRQSTFEMAGHAAEGDLNWPEPTQPGQIFFRGQIRLDNLADTGVLFGTPDLPADPLTSIGTLTLKDGVVELKESSTRFRTMHMNAQGSLGHIGRFRELNLAGLDLSIEVTGSNVDELFDDALASTEKSIAFELTTNIRGLDQALEVRSFKLAGGGGAVNAKGTLVLGNAWVGTQLNLSGQGDQLSELVPAFPNYTPPDAPWRLNAHVELPDTDHVLFKDGRLAIGSVKIELDGVLDTEDQTRTLLTFSASGDRIGDMGRLGDIPWPDHPFQIESELEGTLNTLNIKSLQARWGESDLSGEGSVQLADRPFIEVHGRSEVLDLYDLQHALFGAPEDIEPEDDSTKVFADQPIPIHLFADFDGVLDIQVDRFRGQRSRLEDVNLELDVTDGMLELKRAAYRDETGYFDASALLKPEGDNIYLEFVLKGEDADFGFFTSAAQNRESVPRYSLDVDIWGHGRTVAELAGNLNGKLLISSNGGEINNALLQAFAGDFMTNVVETLNPFVETEQFTPMECLVLNAAIRDGRLKMEPGFVMRTDKLNMFVYGGVDLERETLDLSLATQARRGIGISAATITNPYFKIGGTLAAPALQLDPTSAAIAASVATATAGLSIVIRGLFDRLMGTRNPCPEFLKYEQTLPDRSSAQSESRSEF